MILFSLIRKKFPTCPEGSGKMKNMNFIKLVEKRNQAKRKWHPNFVVRGPILFKLVSMDGEFNSAWEIKSIFTKELGVVPRKVAKLERVVRN